MEARRYPVTRLRLSLETLGQAPTRILRAGYDPKAARIGVVHFGPGAFHRAHQADYFDRMLATDLNLGICAVSLRSDDLRQALSPQDGLYSLTEREENGRTRIIGSIREVLTAPRTPDLVLARLSDPVVRFVTSTVTEKGYCLTQAGDLDEGHPDIERDLRRQGRPVSLVGWLTAGLALRSSNGADGVTVLSCDNLSGNGDRLKHAVLRFAALSGAAELADWIAAEVQFPNTMVDSITPATDDALRKKSAEDLELEDAWPIQRERFSQWVIEGDLGPYSELFVASGVTLAEDVAGFERAKLRLLNGAHSTLAYLGLALGHETVADAMADHDLATFVERLMRKDIAPRVGYVPGLDLDAYISAVLARFRNLSIVHFLSQIAWDGSKKLPVRLLSTAAEIAQAGGDLEAISVGVAAWMDFVRRRLQRGDDLIDPARDDLNKIALSCTGDPERDTGLFLDMDSVFPAQLQSYGPFRAGLARAYGKLQGGRPREVLLP